jgi:hypothetical protein
MLKVFQTIQDFSRDPRISEILRLQQIINDLSPDRRLGILFRRKWGRTKVQISFPSELGIEHVHIFNLDTAYWYIQGIADGLVGLSRNSNLN